VKESRLEILWNEEIRRCEVADISEKVGEARFEIVLDQSEGEPEIRMKRSEDARL
jgi:hypothetical protein